jgi:5-methylcytosine-specific restriction endonuclease McrA
VKIMTTSPRLHSLIKDRTVDFELLPRFEMDIVTGQINDFIQSVRKFYLLLPQAALIDDWDLKPKHHRREVIRDHLRNICVASAVSQASIQKLDIWLVNRNSVRSRLSQFGASLQAKYGSFCFVCGRKIHAHRTVDHVVPLVFGGDETDENLILAHQGCNSAKNSMIAGDSLHWLSDPIDGLEDHISTRLRYLVFLRDNFTCTEAACNKGLFSRTEITVRRKVTSGICCFDNLTTVCVNCPELK